MKEQAMKQRVAIVTGVGDGLGKGIAVLLLQNGYRVAGFDNCPKSLEVLASEVTNGVFLSCVANVLDEDSVNEAVARVMERFGKIDVLVNNVGGSMGIAKPVEEISLEEFEKVLALNLRSTFLCCRAAIPVMKQNGYGRIINISSMAGRSRSVFGGTPYAAAKAAILGFTRQSSKDLGRHGITINAIAPGTVLASERIRQYWEVNRTVEERKLVVDMTPVGRMGDAEDVARCVLFLADEGASYITGSVLDVNGGAWVG